MGAWLGRGLTAAAAAGERADLWPSGALASFGLLAALPLLLAVVPLPSRGDLAFAAAGLASAASFPLNLAPIVLAALGLLLAVRLLGALGQAQLVRLLAGTEPGAARRTSGADVRRICLVRLAALVPLGFALGPVGLLVYEVAPTEFISPDIGGADALTRTLVGLAPAIGLLLVALMAAQALEAAVGRRVVRDDGGLRRAVRTGLEDLAARPLASAALAGTGTLAGTGYALLAVALLRTLWAPIGGDLARGQIDPATLPLLLGFVLIWLCTVTGAGALHGWLAMWWAAELRRPAGGRQPSN